jgi:hopanoid-associated phosphorylase
MSVRSIASILVSLSALSFSINAFAGDPKMVLVISGMTSEESIALADPGTVSVLSGGDAATLQKNLAAIDPASIKAVISFGVAGALNPALKAGNIVIADHVITDDGTLYTTDAAVSAAAYAPLKKHRLTVFSGAMVGSALEHYTSQDKAALFAKTGATAVDMESGAAAAYAQAHNLPFAVIRTISDPQSLSFPKAVRDALQPDGSIDFSAVLADLFQDPSQLGSLIEVAFDAMDAFARLQRVGHLVPLGDL